MPSRPDPSSRVDDPGGAVTGAGGQADDQDGHPASSLRRGDRPGLAEQIVRDLNAATLRQPPAVEEALATVTVGLVSIITAMETVIAELEVAMTTEFDRHRQAEQLRSVPGLGPGLAARVLAEISDDPNRFATASGLCAFAGTAPITRASGRTNTVNARHIRNRRLGDACHWWAFAALTKSPGARAHYDRRRAAGDGHNAALRNLANKLLSRLWWCLVNNQTWDETAAWPAATTPPTKAAA
jgi:transposase